VFEIAFDLNEQQWRVTLMLDDLQLGAFNFLPFDPFLHVLYSPFGVSICLPFGIVQAGQVGDGDILHQRRQRILIESLFDEFLGELRRVLCDLHINI